MLIMVKAKTCGVVKAFARYEVSLCDPSPRFLPFSLVGNIVPWPNTATLDYSPFDMLIGYRESQFYSFAPLTVSYAATSVDHGTLFYNGGTAKAWFRLACRTSGRMRGGCSQPQWRPLRI